MSPDFLTNRSPRLVELAGPAGAGKSATRRALIARSPAEGGTVWGLPVSSLLRNGMELAPSFIPLWRQARSPLWEETRHMVRLRTLQRSLQRGGSAPNAIIFDEGPVFALARLRAFGHPIMRSEGSEHWWRATVHEWAGLIDAVVVLDAPDEVLAQRIRSRAEDHEVKQAPDPELAAWMARFRQALNWVLARLVLENGMTVLRLDTSSDTPKQLAEQALAGLDRSVYAG
jgi:AAA domain-containing protein